jgi:hypothetical protein
MLQTLALLQSGTDFETLKALNPHLPPEPDEVAQPTDPMHNLLWSRWDEDKRAQEKSRYEEALARRQVYLDALAAWKSDAAVRTAPGKLAETLRDLERRGLLQYDASGKRYDLHPLVRGVAAGRMAVNETLMLGQMVVDHFTRQSHDPWEQAKTLEDVAPGLNVVRVLIRMRRYKEAFYAYRGDLAMALFYNLEADAERQALLKPFFPDGWDHQPVQLDESDIPYLLSEAAGPLLNDYPEQAQKLFERTIALNGTLSDGSRVVTALPYLAVIAENANRLAEMARILSLALEISEAMEVDDEIFRSKLFLVRRSIECGDRVMANTLWRELDGMSRPRNRALYRPGDLEASRIMDLFYRGELTEEALAEAETSAKNGYNRRVIRRLHRLRGEWCLAQKEPASAVESLTENLQMSREVGDEAASDEALIALARLRAGTDFDARGEAERLTAAMNKATKGALALAELWHTLGERNAAVEHALRAHRWAAAEGEPYVHRYYLDRARALLGELGVTLPEVPR